MFWEPDNHLLDKTNDFYTSKANNKKRKKLYLSLLTTEPNNK